jgi:Mrp family chromosome partitioning ATPase
MFSQNGVRTPVIGDNPEWSMYGSAQNHDDAIMRESPAGDLYGATYPEGTAPADLTSGGPLLKPVPATLAIRIERTCETFTHLHTNIEYAASRVAMGVDALSNDSLFQMQRPVIIGVTSAIAGEGKTTVALHLAMDIARNNFKQVCLIDMALGEDTLSKRLGVNTGRGLVHVLEGTHHAIPTLESSEIEGLHILPAGKTPDNAARTARSPAVAEVLAASRELFDVMIVDLPAVATGNTLPIMPHLDAYVLVTRAGVTPRSLLQESLQHLDQKKLLGVVLNRVSSPTPRWLQKRLRPW